MANTIALRKAYSTMLDEVYKLASLTAVLDGPNELVKEGANANEILIPKMTMQGLANYNKQTGYVAGDVTLEYETKKCTYDRGRMFNVDAMDNIESAGVAFGRLSGEFLRTQVIPELDTWRLASYAQLAGKKVEATANIPAIVTGGISIVSTLIEGIASQLPGLIPVALTMILTLVSSLLGNLGEMVDAGIELLQGLAEGVVNALPQLINKAPVIIGQFASTVISNLPKILAAGVKILVTLATGLVSAIPQLIGKIPSIISQIKSAFTSVNWGSVGINIIQGIASGVASAAGSLVDAAVNAATNALEWVKSKLGIHSPSRVFRDEVGKMMALGMGIGFEKNVPVKSMSKGVQAAVDSLRNKALVATSAKSQTSVDRFVRHPEPNSGGGIDWNEWERRQRKINKERDSRPIFLGTKRIDYPLPKGAVPQV